MILALILVLVLILALVLILVLVLFLVLIIVLLLVLVLVLVLILVLLLVLIKTFAMNTSQTQQKARLTCALQEYLKYLKLLVVYNACVECMKYFSYFVTSYAIRAAPQKNSFNLGIFQTRSIPPLPPKNFETFGALLRWLIIS